MAILQSKANEVFAAAGLSHLPRKRRVSRVPQWRAETLRAVVSTFLCLNFPNQETSFQPQGSQDLQLVVHSPHPARAGGHWLCWSEPRIRWSQVLQEGCGGGGRMGAGQEAVGQGKPEFKTPVNPAGPRGSTPPVLPPGEDVAGEA